jgi:hypothetical protein
VRERIFYHKRRNFWLISVSLTIVLGAGGVIANFQLAQKKEITPITTISPKMDLSSNIPELVANQIDSGDKTCPDVDILTYESCLLFQGTLGTWYTLGMPNKCPNVGDAKTQANLKTGSTLLISAADALRAPKSACFAYLYAIGIANLVPVVVSSSNRRFQMSVDTRFLEPGSDAGLCLTVRYGICGNHEIVGQALLERIGIKARPLEFYYQIDGQRKSHVIVEAYIDGNWHPIDTTYGAYWPTTRINQPFQLLRTQELLGKSKNQSKPIWNEALLPYSVASQYSESDYFNYLDSNASVIRGSSGTVRLNINENSGSELFAHIPNFVGDNITDKRSKGVNFQLLSNKKKYQITIKSIGGAFSGNEPVFICVSNFCERYLDEKTEYVFEAQKSTNLYLKTKMDVAYVILKSLDWKNIPS